MADYQILKASIAAVIKNNGNQEITGDLLQSTLFAIVNSLGTGYQFAGVADQAVIPGTPDAKVFYIAAGPGIYDHFGNLVVNPGELAFFFIPGGSSSWYKMSVPIGISGYSLYSKTVYNWGALPAIPSVRGKYFIYVDRIQSTIKHRYIYVSDPDIDGGAWKNFTHAFRVRLASGETSTSGDVPVVPSEKETRSIVAEFFPYWRLRFPRAYPESMSGDLQDFLQLFDIQEVQQDFLDYFQQGRIETIMPRLVVLDRDQTHDNILVLNLVWFERYYEIYSFVFGNSYGFNIGQQAELTINNIVYDAENNITDFTFTLDYLEI